MSLCRGFWRLINLSRDSAFLSCLHATSPGLLGPCLFPLACSERMTLANSMATSLGLSLHSFFGLLWPEDLSREPLETPLETKCLLTWSQQACSLILPWSCRSFLGYPSVGSVQAADLTPHSHRGVWFCSPYLDKSLLALEILLLVTLSVGCLIYFFFFLVIHV